MPTEIITPTSSKTTPNNYQAALWLINHVLTHDEVKRIYIQVREKLTRNLVAARDSEATGDDDATVEGTAK